jgi:NADP-dependent 3-hydroxy acid dehydrogenase YdfG
MMCPKQPKNRVVVVAGASIPARHATARRFAAQGAHVVLAGPTEPSLVESAKAIRREGGSVTHVLADAAKHEGAQAIRAHAELMFGPVDLWIEANALPPKRSLQAKALLVLSLGAALFGLARFARAS